MAWCAVSAELCLVYFASGAKLDEPGQPLFVLLRKHPKMRILGNVTWLKAVVSTPSLREIEEGVHYISERPFPPDAFRDALPFEELKMAVPRSSATLQEYVRIMYVERHLKLRELQGYKTRAVEVIKRAIKDEIDLCFHNAMVREHLGGKTYEECVAFIKDRAGPKCSVRRNMEKNALAGYDARTVSERLLCLQLQEEKKRSEADAMEDDIPLDEIEAMENPAVVHTKNLSDMINRVWSFPNLARANTLPDCGFYVYPAHDPVIKQRFGTTVFAALVVYCSRELETAQRTYLNLPERYDTAPVMLAVDCSPRKYIVCDPVRMHARWKSDTAAGVECCWHEVFLPGRSVTNIPLDLDVATHLTHWDEEEFYETVLNSLLTAVAKTLEENFGMRVEECKVGAFYLYQRRCTPEKKKASLRVLWQLPLQMCAMNISIEIVGKLMREVCYYTKKHTLPGLVDETNRRYFTDVLTKDWCLPEGDRPPVTLKGKEGGETYLYDPKFSLKINLGRAVSFAEEAATLCCLDVQPYGPNRSLHLALCDKPNESRFEFKRCYNRIIADSEEFWANPALSPVACLSCVPVDATRSFLIALSAAAVQEFHDTIRNSSGAPSISAYQPHSSLVMRTAIDRLALLFKIPTVFFHVPFGNIVYPKSAEHCVCPLHERKHKTLALRFAVSANSIRVLCWKPNDKVLYLQWSAVLKTYERFYKQ